MTEDIKILSKALVHDKDTAHTNFLKQFFAENNLIGLRAENHNSIHEVLKTNIDLGVVFLCEEDSEGKSGLEIMEEIHDRRPELPVFLRRNHSDSLDDLPLKVQQACVGAYIGQDEAKLHQLLERHLFNTFYPSSFIRGIEELTLSAVESTFKDVNIECSVPYLVRDLLIFGEMFSIMILEGNWCRGYMMLQTEEGHMLDLIRSGKTNLMEHDADFRTVNDLMNECTNMVWGAFKARFFKTGEEEKIAHRVQVPVIVNHHRRYITFGSKDPQLCFRYTLHDPEGKLDSVDLYQKFVFNLTWSPDEFQEKPEELENLVSAGELELF